MQIESGTSLAHYEILSPLGKGGMGEVYRARDTKLGREVAIKILPEEFTKDVERLARFEREARVLASLDHPHVAAIHGFEDVEGVRFLVMQLADGEDLSDRLRRGPIPVDEALEMATQIAQALEAAHEQGVVHRDLKPANIKIDEEGKVRVLDFGLAKALETEESDDDFSNSPTMVRAATHAGVILGTAAYMSPEQARGKRVDKRADIWAFGVVLWEMLTGKRLFGRETVSDTLASVLKEEPDWSALPAATPQVVRRVLRRCLVRNPHDRMHDIGDARIELLESDELFANTPITQPKSPRVAWIVAVLAAIISAAAIGWALSKESPANSGQPIYLRLPLEPAAYLGQDPSVVISPDGLSIAYIGEVDGRTHILIRDLTSTDVTVVPGSDAATRPAFAADGSSIVFGAGENIWRWTRSGGDPSIVLKEDVSNGVCWSPSGTLVFNGSWGTGLRRVPEGGGSASQLTELEPGASHIWPYCLPDGEHVLYTRWTAESTEAIAIYSVSLTTGETREIIRDAKNPRVFGDILTFLRGTTLMAVRFDAERLETKGAPVPIVSKVSHDPGALGASYDVSRTGTLAYVPASEAPDQRGFWFDLEGNRLGLVEPKLREWAYPAISEDGSKLLVTEQGPAFQIWLIDLDGGPKTQLTNRHDNGEAIWTPDGRVVYFSNRNGRYEILRQRADGTGETEILVGGIGAFPVPADLSPDGRYLLYSDVVEGDRDLWTLELDGEHEPRRFLTLSGAQRNAAFSPDGRYIAYESTESGQREVYVTPFPGPGTSWQISTEGGVNPTWSPDGSALYFHEGKTRMMKVSTIMGSSFRASAPTVMFEETFKRTDVGRQFDLSQDGTKFLLMETPDRSSFERLNVVLNWGKVVEEKLPAK